MGRSHKTFPKGNGEMGEVKELKQKIKRLESDKRKLLSELRTLQEAFDKSRQFISKKVADISVEDLIRFSDKNLEQLQDIVTCKECSSTKFTYLSHPNGSKIKMCLECKHREASHDTSECDSSEAIL